MDAASVSKPIASDTKPVPLTSEGAGWSRGYATYALTLLLMVNVLNYVDRTVLSVLAEPIKHDLSLDDAQLGFLYGTAFALFNTLFSVAIGRLADVWLGTRVLSIGVLLWSAMTTFSGLASNYWQLAVARFGVGIGEAAATPCGYSLIIDIFPSRQRAVKLSIYLCGTYIGMALSLGLGGLLVRNWPHVCTAVSGLCAVHGWQAAFFVSGFPGILVGLLAWRMREPANSSGHGRLSGIKAAKVAALQLETLIPPFSFIRLARLRQGRLLAINVAVGLGIAVIAAGLSWVSGNPLQWICFCVGTYGLFSWAQGIASEDPALGRLTFRSPAFCCWLAGLSLIGVFNQSVVFWAVPLSIRALSLRPDFAGVLIGLSLALGSLSGTLIGGRWADSWRRHDVRGPVWIAVISVFITFPCVLLMTTAKTTTMFLIGHFSFALGNTLWGGGSIAFLHELVLPRTRATVSALYVTVIILFSIGAGPYLAGRLGESMGGLAHGLQALAVLLPFAIVLFVICARRSTSAIAKMVDMADQEARAV